MMLENDKYNLERIRILCNTPGRRSKEGTAVAIIKEITHKTNYPGGSSEDLPDKKKKEDSMFYISTPNRPGDRAINQKKNTAP